MSFDALLKNEVVNEMNVVIKYLVVPFVVLVGCVNAFQFVWEYSPPLVLSGLAGIIALVLVRGYFSTREDLRRGWRVMREGRDQVSYEEMIQGNWERIVIDGEMGGEGSPHSIYFPSTEEWHDFPGWAVERQAEISARIREVLKPPRFEYHEAEQGGDDQSPSPSDVDA